MQKKIYKLITAFTLIELFIVITIILVLSSLSIYTYEDYKIKTQFNSAFNTVESNKQVIVNYYAKNTACPPDNFINQNITSTKCTATTTSSCVASIVNVGCTLNLYDAQTPSNAIISFKASITNMGDMQFFCILGPVNAPPNKYLSIPCNPNDFTIPSNYTVL